MGSAARASTVLVVDDDRLLVDTLAVWLEDEGFQVRRAYDGLQGLAAANRAPPDLVLADIAMPGINGLRLAALMRERGVPIVLLSSADAPPGMPPDVPFLPKPFDIEDIYDVIVKMLTKSEEHAVVSHGR